MKSFHFEPALLLHSTWTPKVLTLIFCLLLVFLGIDILHYFNKPAPSLEKNTQIKSSSSKLSPPSQVLFGTYIPANFKGLEIKKSSLDVEIAGILYSVDEQQSQVILRAGGRDDKIYRVGDEIPGGALIKKIRSHGIVILSHGRLESIIFLKHPLKFETQSHLIFKE